MCTFEQWLHILSKQRFWDSVSSFGQHKSPSAKNFYFCFALCLSLTCSFTGFLAKPVSQWNDSSLQQRKMCKYLKHFEKLNIFVISHGAVSNSKSLNFVYCKGMSIQKSSVTELLALWVIFTTKLGGRLLEFSDTFPFVQYKCMPCSIWTQCLPQPYRECTIVITLAS